jgi:hypothetical protein
MTCRGYDVKSVKVPKPVKTLAATFLDKAQRRGFIKSYVAVFEAESRQRGSRSKKDA